MSAMGKWYGQRGSHSPQATQLRTVSMTAPEKVTALAGDMRLATTLYIMAGVMLTP